MKHPDPKSKRSKRRENRGFKSLEVSSRKHRRALRRSYEVRGIFIGGMVVVHDAGTKVEPDIRGGRLKSFEQNAGGSIKYHKS